VRESRTLLALPRALPASGCCYPAPAATTSMAKLKLALVGCGRICEVAHFPGYEQHAADLVEITACVDINAARAELLAGKAGPQCQVFTSLDDALAEGDFDAVDLMLLHTDHESAIMACFAAGKHVLMEKPMATSVAECSRIMQAAEESGKTFMISEQSQYWAPVVRAQELIASGAIGNVTSVTAYYKQASTTNMWANVLDGAGGQGDAKGVATHETGEPKPWRYDKRLTGGGVSIDGGAHWLRPMNMLTPGKIEEVIGVIGHPFQPMEGESFARALCRFDSGVVSTFETDYSDSTFFGPENAL
jgi:predicted dehydrogenase